MLRVYSVVLEVLAGLRGVIEGVERRDGDLARQLRRAGTSVVLNLAEGSYSQGGNRRARYYNAMGSMSEVLAGVEAAVALGYVKEVDPKLVAQMRQVLGTLVRLVR